MSSINEKIIINEMDKPELIGNIIDIFEDFLDDKGIIIPNPEKDEDPELDMESPSEYLRRRLRFFINFIGEPASKLESY